MKAAAVDTCLPRGYLRACLLLLTAESPSHGYELVVRVGELGLPKPDPGGLYRTLRGLEDEGLVRSWWAPAVAGPARRLYRATKAGRDSLARLTASVADDHQHLAVYLQRHRSLEDRSPRSESRVDRLAFECENAEDALVHAVERFAADEAFQCFDAERELA